MIISTGSRVLATFLYFAPSLGLLPILYHWQFGSIGTSEYWRYVYDNDDEVIYFKDQWQLSDNLIDYTWLSYQHYAIIYACLALIQTGAVIIINVKAKKMKNFEALGKGLEFVLCPPIDGIFHLAAFTLGNLVLMIPMWILRHNIAK